jgi:hypothetical protein
MKMFTSEEIKFMRSIGLDFDFDHLTEKEIEEIEDAVSDRLEFDGLDEDYNPTPIGSLCEDILYKIP